MSEAQFNPPANPADVVPPPLPVQAASPVRFCRTCGTPWEPAWAECARCVPAAVAQTRAIAASGPQSEYERDVRYVKSSVLLYMVLLGVCLIGALVAVVDKKPLGVTGDVVVSALLSAVSLGWCLFTPAGILPLLRRGASWRWYALAAGSAVATYLMASGAIHALEVMVNLPVIHYLEPYETAGVDWRWAILLVCVQPAIFEELAFRGFIQTSLGRVIGPYEAVFASALMFAILHCSMPSLPHLLVLGVALAFLRLKTGSLYPGMLLHFSHNFLVLLSEHYGRIMPW